MFPTAHGNSIRLQRLFLLLLLRLLPSSSSSSFSFPAPPPHSILLLPLIFILILSSSLILFFFPFSFVIVLIFVFIVVFFLKLPALLNREVCERHHNLQIVLARAVVVLQAQLDMSVNPWTTQNNMVLKLKKCKEMIVRFRRHVEHSPPALTVDNKTLETVHSHKGFGVTLQSNLKLDLHVDKIVGKASKRLHILLVLKRGGVPPSDLLRIYSSLTRSVLVYRCPVWHSFLPVHLSRVEWSGYVQNRVLRIIYPVLRYQEVLVTSGYTKLRIRRDELCSKTFERIKRPE